MKRLRLTLVITILAGILPCLAFAEVEYPPAEYLSGTLPVLYITTQDSLPVTSKTDYVDGTYYLDAMGIEGFESIGDIDNQRSLQIRGRGNSTWQLDKKPYKIKLDKKTALLGMSKNKHWALLAEHHDHLGKMMTAGGFEMSRRFRLEWTPSFQPVELVLNGNYEGLYFLTETIKVGANRVNIVEQADGATDPDEITGGWLVEIDNWAGEDNQFKFVESPGLTIRFTIHSPDSLSAEQWDYIRGQMTMINEFIYSPDKEKPEWSEFIDMESLARYYAASEAIDDLEAFNGSCYLWKDLGVDEKWHFGPMWDFGSSGLRSDPYNFIFDNAPSYTKFHWIKELVRYPTFMRRVREVWREYYAEGYPTFESDLREWGQCLIAAGMSDYSRWPDGAGNLMTRRWWTYFTHISKKADYLQQQWEFDPTDVNHDRIVDVIDLNILIDFIMGFKMPEESSLPYLDVNADGVVDVLDINSIINDILSW